MRLVDHLRAIAARLVAVADSIRATPARHAVQDEAAALRGLADRIDEVLPGDAATCAGPQCGRPIVWVVLGGKPHPCDPPIRAVVTEDGKIVRGRESHYATCPNAADFRR